MANEPTIDDMNLKRMADFYSLPDIVKAFRVGNLMWCKPFLDKAIAQTLTRTKKKIGEISVVDLGCGTAVFGEYLLGRGVQSYTGIDVAPEMASDALAKAGDKATIVNANYRNTADTKIAEIAGKFDVVLAIGASDWQNNFFKHIADVIRFAKDGATVVDVEYFEGNFQDGVLKSDEKPLAAILKNQTKFVELGISMSTSVVSALMSLIKNPRAVADFIKLAQNPTFQDYSVRANLIPLTSIRAFVSLANAQVGVMTGGPYNPAVIVFEVTPGLREIVAKVLATGGES